MSKTNKWAIGLMLVCVTVAVVFSFVSFPSPSSVWDRVHHWWVDEDITIATGEKARQTKAGYGTTVQTLYYTQGLDYPRYVPANSFFRTKETPDEGVILFRFAKSKNELTNTSWRRLERGEMRLSDEIADGAIWIDFRLPEEIGHDNEIEISVAPK